MSHKVASVLMLSGARLALANPICIRAAFASFRWHQPTAAATKRFTPSLSSIAAVIDDFSAPDTSLDSEDVNSNLESVLQVRNELIALSKDLALDSPSGLFITRKPDKVKFQDAVASLEAIAPKPSKKVDLLGDWTLLATANVPSSNIRSRLNKNDTGSKKEWFKQQINLNPIQKTIQKSLSVTQRIRTDGTFESTDLINRVDNVIEVTPLDTLGSVLPSDSPLSNLINGVNINPLQVSALKIVLVHKAVVESTSPILRTKISPSSTVVNVAGSSSFFTPEGEDVFGVNNILGDFQSGTFDTPFVDEDVRISRSSGPVFETLRVFVRQTSHLEEDKNSVDSLEADFENEEKVRSTYEVEDSQEVTNE